MSEPSGDNTSAVPDAADPIPTAGQPEALADLMASVHAARGSAGTHPAPDLDARALEAAERALLDGQRALANARSQLRDDRAPALQAGRRRELGLRILLGLNILAMVAVAMLPPALRPAAPPAAAPPVAAPPANEEALRRFHEPFNNALVAADRGHFAEAVAILEQYLAESPHLVASQQLNVLNMLSHYAGLANDFAAAQQFAQRAAALGQSHSLPTDLVAMAQAAIAKGDQETLRRVWARFLLQQRQIPSWLHQHVAEAYLQLGDSYRQQANDAAERARVAELEQAAERLRAEAARDGERGK